MFIYLDESGDLGFDFSKKKTTKKFVITLLVCNSESARKEFAKAVRRTLKNKEEVRDFNQYLINQLEALLPLNTDLNILHLTSQESTGLQAVDLFSWGIFRKYENNDVEWYKVYGDKVRFETEYLR